MAYYNWEEIMLKDTSELMKIIRDRVLNETAIDYAKKELSNRNNPIFNNSRFISLKRDLQIKNRNWQIRNIIIYSGECFFCNKESHYLHIIEKPTGLKVCDKIVLYNELHFSVLATPFGIFFPSKNWFSNTKEGMLSICIECGQPVIKCPKCNSFQTLKKDKQLCNACGQKIKKPTINNG
jgi:hypothetical protein